MADGALKCAATKAKSKATTKRYGRGAEKPEKSNGNSNEAVGTPALLTATAQRRYPQVWSRSLSSTQRSPMSVR